MLPSLERLPLAVRAPADGAAARTGVFVDEEDFVEPLPRPYMDYGAPRPLTHQLLTNTYTLVPFSMAFHAPAPPPAARLGLGTAVWCRQSSLEGADG